MDPRMQTILAEEHRKDIVRQMHGIRLEEQALQGAAFHPNWFTRALNGFGRWLIARGEDLVRRNETPGEACQPTGREYAPYSG
jgi:hypothetical protein